MRVFAVLILSVVLLSFTWQDQKKVKSMERGKEIYNQLCIACHQANGEGIPGAFPPLAKSDYLLEDITRGIHAVKFGLQGEIVVNGKTYNSIMTSQQLTDPEVADVLNYVLNSWGNSHDYISPEQVKAVDQ
ncbi:c-type cytochrome [Fulvivirga sedimenti]|uniref:Cytochrome c n=1 Tax=Fulvivirga sedimenti TaxID=2879465 RepID=A0A9X1HVV9_9BACT|nr:cytochrome c [Fulvivirga sedimenti]MCA6074922.1 cytochrome c [Fulvivirga sedimenti]MCA6076099.1 cytochrome c [Fulvivirga sedimenti]MCA6077227.1 cytochrome c [Fulvivirga sedimenti]